MLVMLKMATAPPQAEAHPSISLQPEGPAPARSEAGTQKLTPP